MDWKLLIGELQERGLTQPQIAAICGCGQATISDLASGTTKDPRHSLGKRLEELAERLRGEDPAEPLIVTPTYVGHDRRGKGGE